MKVRDVPESQRITLESGKTAWWFWSVLKLGMYETWIETEKGRGIRTGLVQGAPLQGSRIVWYRATVSGPSLWMRPEPAHDRFYGNEERLTVVALCAERYERAECQIATERPSGPSFAKV